MIICDEHLTFREDGQVLHGAALIKRARKVLGFKNTKMLGIPLGVSPRTVEGWEQGRRPPGKSALILLSKLLAEQ